MATLKTLKTLYYRMAFGTTAAMARAIAEMCSGSGFLAGYSGSAFLAEYHGYLANYLDDPEIIQAAVDHTVLGIPKREYFAVCARLSQEHLEHLEQSQLFQIRE